MGTTDAVGRTRSESISASPATQPMRANDSYNQPRRMDDQPRYRNMDQPTIGASPEQSQGQIMNGNSRGQMRNADAQPQNNGQMQPAAMPQQDQRQRGGFFQNVFGAPANNGGQATGQPRQRSYEQPQQRSYEQPRQQRTYEQPQQRTYEQPQQRSYSQPSNSAPSYGGGGGGGNSGGGGRGRGRGE